MSDAADTEKEPQGKLFFAMVIGTASVSASITLL